MSTPTHEPKLILGRQAAQIGAFARLVAWWHQVELRNSENGESFLSDDAEILRDGSKHDGTLVRVTAGDMRAIASPPVMYVGDAPTAPVAYQYQSDNGWSAWVGMHESNQLRAAQSLGYPIRYAYPRLPEGEA